MIDTNNIRSTILTTFFAESGLIFTSPNSKAIALKEVTTLRSGVDLKSKYLSDICEPGMVPYITGASSFNFDSIVLNRWTSSPTNLAEPGSVLLTCKGSVGKVAYAPDLPSHIARQVMSIKPNQTLDRHYLFYFLLSLNHYFVSRQKGIIPGIEKKDVLEALIPLPPLEEQKRIVAKIEELFAKIDEIDKAQKELKELAELAEKKVLSALINENEDSMLKKIGCLITDIRYGSSEKTDYNNTGTPVLRIPNISNGTIDFNDLKKSKSILKESLLLKRNDILMIRSNGSRDIVGKAGLYSNEDNHYSFASFLIRIRPDINIINANYLTLLLNSNYVREQMFSKSKSSSGINNINSKEIKEISIPVLPLSDQMNVIERYEAVSSILDSIR